MKVAVIDNGISRGLLRCPVEYYVIHEGKVVEEDSGVTEFSHGSRCARLVVRGISDVEVVSLRIHPEFADGTERDLLAALLWCVNHPVDLINMSNGIASFFHNEAINDVCYQLWKRGTLLVAAVSNTWEYTVPANLPYVRSVSTLPLFSWKKKNPFTQADRKCRGLALLRKRNGGVFLSGGNSFSCARESNRLLKKMRRGFVCKQSVSSHLTDFAMLKQVVIWGREALIPGMPVCMKEVEMKTEGIEVDTTLVIADCKSGRRTLNQLKRIQETVDLLIWCDRKIPIGIKRWCEVHKTSFWKEPRWVGRSFHDTACLSQLKDVFVIAIHGEELPLREALQLKRAFSEQGYHTLLFSNTSRSYLYGAFPFTDSRRILQICKAVHPSVILIDPGEDICLNCDLRIDFDSGGVWMESEKGKERLGHSPTGITYPRIVKMIEDMNDE